VDFWTEALSFGSKLFGVARDWLASGIPKRSLILIPRDFRPPFTGPTFWSVANFPGPPRAGNAREVYLQCEKCCEAACQDCSVALKIFRRHFGLLLVSACVVDGRCLLQPDAEADIYGDYAVRPEAPAVQAEAHWLVEPAIAADGESFRAKVCLVDDFGNEHWTRKLTFRPQR
jgi:hypothetical protein